VRIVEAEAEAAGLDCARIETTPGPGEDTLASVAFELRLRAAGEGLVRFIAAWEGTIQWIGRSPLRPTHRRRNWFIKATTIDLERPSTPALREADLDISAIRAGGAGGQNVNKRSTAVRVVHRPSGLEVVAREERTQGQNRRVALDRLRALLAGRAADGAAATQRARWSEHQAIVRGNAQRVFRGPKFTAVTSE